MDQQRGAPVCPVSDKMKINILTQIPSPKSHILLAPLALSFSNKPTCLPVPAILKPLNMGSLSMSLSSHSLVIAHLSLVVKTGLTPI